MVQIGESILVSLKRMKGIEIDLRLGLEKGIVPVSREGIKVHDGPDLLARIAGVLRKSNGEISKGIRVWKTSHVPGDL